MFTLGPVDESFFDTATWRFAETFAIGLPAHTVWSELTADGALSFCRSLRGATWTSPRPFGVGTTRTMRAAFGTLLVEDTYFRWEEGRRQSFYASATSLPLYRRLAEDYLVEGVSPGACRLTWTIALDPQPIVRLSRPMSAAVVNGIFRDTRRHFAGKRTP